MDSWVAYALKNSPLLLTSWERGTTTAPSQFSARCRGEGGREGEACRVARSTIW